jgi:pimeloyl-ACP methyl ester carboxylesterase
VRVVTGDGRIVVLPSGGALHVADARSGRPLLFLHGVGGGAWSWRPQRDAFAGAVPLYVWEARGHGAAARVADAGLADYYADAREALDAVRRETGKRPVIVGHSMGGLLALTLACEAPQSVGSLFLVDPVYASEGGAGHVPAALGPLFAVLATPLVRSVANNGPVARMLMRRMWEHSFRDRARMEAAWPDQQAQVPIEYPRMIRESFTGPADFRIHAFTEEVACAVSVLEGSARGGRRFPELLAGLRARLGDRFAHESIDGGHYLQLDRPAEVNARIARFVALRLSGPEPV